MDERLPLENRSLTHTSKEPEGQAWAQIGTNVPKVKTTFESPVKIAPTIDNAAETSNKNGINMAAVTSSETPAISISISSEDEVNEKTKGEKEEDAMSDEQELQVVEGADAERIAEDEPPENSEGGKDANSSATAENIEKEKEEGEGEKGSEEENGDTKKKGETEKARTNSNNPRLVRSRVFVGHLNTEKCSRKEIEELFSPYGKVIGCSLQHGYGFVQYEDEEGARKAIRELHGLHFKGMKLVVDKTAALKKMLGENPSAPKPWQAERREKTSRHDEMEYMRRRDLYDRYARIEELERMYYDRYPPPPPSRDSYYERFAERYPTPSRDPYLERYRYPDMERAPPGGRYYDRYPQHGGPPGEFERPPFYDRPFDHHPEPSYDRPRDDPYDRHMRENEPMRERDPFERYEASRRL